MNRPAPIPIVIADHDPRWPRLFEEERERIGRAIGEWAIAIEHVSSTAVPGLAAKPIIDIAVALKDLVDGLKCITPLAELGYECKGEGGIPGRLYFRKLTDAPLPGQVTSNGIGRTHQVHMYQRDHEHFSWQVAFRDYLRAHPDARDEYEALKHRLAVEHAGDVEAYADAKSDFVRRVLRKAGMLEQAT